MTGWTLGGLKRSHAREDDGTGIRGTDEELAELFSIRRPLRSSKHLRLPTRGALGNGLRLVAGVITRHTAHLVLNHDR
jgi:hypothetical protein